MKRKEKESVVDQLHGEISKATSVFVAKYRGLTVKDMVALRMQIKELDGVVRVMKNSLSKLALNDTKHTIVQKSLFGPVVLIYVFDDAIQVAKTIINYSKVNKQFQVLCASMEGDFFEKEGLMKLATLPALPQIRAMLVGLLQAPATKIVRVLNEPARRVAYLTNKKPA